jgi:heme/copper-type cytochrome/quinol oxidase subunit 4
VLKLVRAQDPAFEPNPDFLRDMFNVAVGIVWQITLVALPIYFVIQQFTRAAVAAAVVAVTSLILKFTWYDHLCKQEARWEAGAMNPAPPPGAAG